MVAVELPVKVISEFGGMHYGRITYLNGVDVGGSAAQQLVRDPDLKNHRGRGLMMGFVMQLDGVLTTNGLLSRADEIQDCNEALGFKGMKVVPYLRTEESSFVNELIASDVPAALERAKSSIDLPDGRSIPLTRLRFISHTFDARWNRETDFIAEYGGHVAA
jgi:hypothetical protein